MTRRVSVVGAGIAGLAAAFEAARADAGAEVVVYEATERAGGKLCTAVFAGRRVDQGADAFLARVPWGRELCRDLGIEADLVAPATGSASVFCDGALHPLPPGLVLGVPTDFDAAAASGLLTGAVTVRPASPLGPDEDVSVGALVRAQLGDEVFERLVDPLLSGINAGDGDRLSVRAGAPQLAEAAQAGPDLVSALRARAAAGPVDPGPVFLSPRDGMGALVDALLDALTAVGTTVHLDHPITDLADLDADLVVLATPAAVTAGLVAPAAPGVAGTLRALDYSSVALVNLALPLAALTRPLRGSGLLVPRREGLFATAVSYASNKWAHLHDDDGLAVVRVSAGRWGDERHVHMTDDEVVAAILEDLGTILGFHGEPAEVQVNRWPRSLPQFEPGHLARVEEMEADLRGSLANVRLAGAAYRGLGVPACIRSGREAGSPAPRPAPR